MEHGRTRGIALREPVAVATLVERFGGRADPECGARLVARVVSPEDAALADDLVVVARRPLVTAARGARGVLLVQVDLADALPSGARLVHSHPSWLAARLLADVAPPAPPSVHETACVEAGAVVDPTTAVGAFAVVLAGARVGPGGRIGEGAVIHGGVTLGARVVVGPNAVIGRPGFGWVEGPDGAFDRAPQLGGVVVEDDVEIGPLATVDAGTLGPTVIGRGAKLDAHVHVAHNVRIGPGTLVAAQAGFAGSVHVGAGVRVGGQVGVKDHVEIGTGARLAAKSGVIGDVAPGEVVAGYPAVGRVAWLRAWAALLGRRRGRGEAGSPARSDGKKRERR